LYVVIQYHPERHPLWKLAVVVVEGGEVVLLVVMEALQL
jgi:hypothetical protein